MGRDHPGDWPRSKPAARSALAIPTATQPRPSLIEGALAPALLGPGCAGHSKPAGRRWSLRVRNVGRPGIASCAISAIDVALWDLKAKQFDVPLVMLLGQARERVPIYGSGGFTSYYD